MTLKPIARMGQAGLVSALMFLAGTLVPIAGGAIAAFSPVPLLAYTAGLPHAWRSVSLLVLISASFVALCGGVASGASYLFSFGLATLVICYMLERRQPFELIVLSATITCLVTGTIVALILAGSPTALTQAIHSQLVAGILRGQSFYKALRVDVTLTPDLQASLVKTAMKLMPALIGLAGGLVVLLNLMVLWRFGGRQRRLGYPLFGDLSRWSTPEWLIWPLLISGFGWFIPQAILATIAMDCFVCISGIYLCQGLAIMAFYFRHLKMPVLARWLIYFVTLAQPVLMMLVGAAGVFDLWVDFRRLKTPDAAVRNLRNFL